MTPPKKKHILVLEGNIGAGKSTFLDILRRNLDIDVIFEPTDKWQQVGASGNLLNLFYSDTPRWAYTFQSYAFISRVQAQQEHEERATDDKVHVIERSVYCDRYCFAKNCFEAGLMSELEWQIYKEWFGWLVEKYTTRPSGFVYLQATPETCYQRLTKRNRSEESEIPLAYLQALHQRHQDWLIDKKDVIDVLKNVPVLTLDCNQDFELDLEEQAKHIQAVKDFIENIGAITPAKITTFETENKKQVNSGACEGSV